MIKKLVLWILVIACAGMIFLFSSQKAEESDRVSTGVIVKIIRFFDVEETFSEAEIEGISVAFNGIVRVGAHFCIYALLGFLLALLLDSYGICGIPRILHSVLYAFLYSCSDEVHQSFVPGRSAQFSDIVTDTLGALFGAVFAALMLIVISKIRRKNHTV